MKAVQNPTRLYKSLFGKERKPTSKWIVGNLVMGKKYKDPLTRFRLALLLLVDGILCLTCVRTIINFDHVEMVKDVTAFLKYPWGRTSFISTIRSAKQRTAKDLSQDTTAIQGFPHALVLVTVTCCPAIIYTPDAVLNILDPTIAIEKLVQHVLGRSLNINVHDARTIDQNGMDRVTSLLNEEILEKEIDLSFSDEEEDEEVSNLLRLILEEHPFEHNTWSGGVDACDVPQPSDDELLADAGVNLPKSDGEEEMQDEVPGVGAEERQHVHNGEGEDDMEAEVPIDDVETRKEDGSFEGVNDLPDAVPCAGERETPNDIRVTAGYGIRQALIKEAADEFEKRLLKIQQANTVELKAYFDAELMKHKNELEALIKEFVRPVISGQNKQHSHKGEGSQCVADSSSTKEVRNHVCTAPKPLGSMAPDHQNSQPGGSVLGVCVSTDQQTVIKDNKTDNPQKVVGKEPFKKGGKRISSTAVASQSTQPLKRAKGKEQAATAKYVLEIQPPSFSIGLSQYGSNEGVDAVNTDEVNIAAPSVKIDLMQDNVPGSSMFPSREKKNSSPTNVTGRRFSYRVRNSPIKSNTKEAIPNKAIKRRLNPVTGATKVHVSKIAEVEKIPTKPPPKLIGNFDPFSVPSPERLNCFLKQMERATSYALVDAVVLDNTEFLTIYEAQSLLDESGPDVLVRFIQLRRDKAKQRRFDFLPSSFLSELRRQYNKFNGATDKKAFYFTTLTRVPFMVRPKWFEEIDVIYCPMQVERQHWVGLVIDLKKWEVIVLDCHRNMLKDEHVAKYIEHITVMLPYLIRKHGVNAAMLIQRLDPMTMRRPNLQFQCSSLGLVGTASIVLLELHSVNAMKYCSTLDEKKMHDAAKQYAIETFNALAPEAHTA